jgi:hypothetical protein
MIWVLHLNKNGLGNIEHMETKKIHNYVIDINK